MSSRKKVVFATLAAPLAAPIAFFLVGIVFSIREIDDLSDLYRSFVLVFLFALPLSYGAMIFLGIPYYLTLKKFERDNNIALVGGGVVLGATIFLAFISMMKGNFSYISSSPQNLALSLFIGAASGALVAVCFAKLRA